ncbi:MAG: hypothetical protein Q9198_010347, partial [Flavoplaca austrocitrina]
MPTNEAPAVSELIESLQQSTLNDELSSCLVDSIDALMDLIDVMTKLPTDAPSL